MTERPFTEAALLAEVPGLLRYARTLTRDPGEAEDLVQDTLERALRRADGFRAEASLRTWLHRILHHRFVDLTRRSRPVPIADDDLMDRIAQAWRTDAYTVDADAVLTRACVGDDLRDALVHLPTILRSAVVLADVEGMTMAEVAAIQGVGLPAAKQRVRRGRATLVSLLDGNADRRAALAGVPLRCWKARSLIGGYLDDELAPPRRVAVESHLATCPTCPPLYAAIVGVREAAGRLRDPESVVPDSLAARIRAQVTG